MVGGCTVLYKRPRSFLAVVAVAFVTASAAACQARRDTLDVLFIGNSYIYFNDLPAMVEEISAALDGPVIHGVAHTRGGQTLRGHLDEGHLGKILMKGAASGDDWDWVVLQEQSTLGTRYDPTTGVLGDPAAFNRAVRELTGIIRGRGAKPALYMTWAKEAFPGQAETLGDAYSSIGRELDLSVAPVGVAWAAVHQDRPNFNLYISDGSHPTAAGSYLAACVIYATLTGRSPLGAPSELRGAPWDFQGIVESSSSTILVSLPAADAAFLQKAAWDAVTAQRNGAP